jgi:hypothetical protein
VLTAVVHRFARPGGRQDLERLVEHACASAVVELLAGDRVLAREPVAAQADAKRQSAAAEPVERRCFPGDLDRPTSREWGDHRAEPDSLGGGGHRCQRDPRVGHVDHGLLVAQVVPDEHSVPARLLRLGRQARDDRRVGQLIEKGHEQS